MIATGRFNEQAMTTAMRQVAGRLRVPADDARLLRLTNNAVFALPTARLVIRIARSHQLLNRVPKVVQLAQWFAQVDAPTIRLLGGIEQPVQIGDLMATVWHYIPSTASSPTVDDLGPALREFHALATPPFPLPRWDPVGDARRRIADADGLREGERDFLLGWCDRLQPQVTDLNGRSTAGLVHGDAHVGNLLRQPGHRVVWCDFDATCLGPWQVDLAAVAVGEARFGRAGAHAALAAAYGHDVTTDPDWQLLREARELKMIAAAVPLLTSSPGVATEFVARLASIRINELSTRWTPFAEINTPTT